MGEALLTACHVHNRIPSKKFKLSPYEKWKGRKPNLNDLRVRGCLAYYRVIDPKRTKLGPRALRSVFVGYDKHSKAYRLLDLDSNVIVESRDVEFLETRFLKDSTNNQQSNEENTNTSMSQDTNMNNSSVLNKRKTDEFSIEPIRSQRARRDKTLGFDFISSQSLVFLVEGSRNELLNKIPIVFSLESDPKTHKEAINDEIDSLISNGTWKLVDLPSFVKPIGCKRVFRRKYNTDGSLQTFKARLVVKGLC